MKTDLIERMEEAMLKLKANKIRLSLVENVSLMICGRVMGFK